MPKIPYKTFKLRPDTYAAIDKANEILEDYAARGYDLTLRQLYYQFVARDLLANTVQSYNRLGDIIDKGRLMGLIDWDHIVDRTRNLKSRSSFTDPGDVIRAADYSYHLSRWAGQDYRVEVWVEKEALIGIFARVCSRWDVPYFACRGYTSQSEMWRAARRLNSYENEGWTPVILHFGDMDPSGVDMTRDIEDRLAMFRCQVDVKRLALNMDQVEKYKPPPNPAKTTDARFRSYLLVYGSESWELDALDPDVLAALVEDAVNGFRDPQKWSTTVEREIEDRALLKTAAQEWSDVSDHLVDNHEDRIEDNKDSLKKDYEFELVAND